MHAPGDKGDTVNLGLACYDKADFHLDQAACHSRSSAAALGPLAEGAARRYELPNLEALDSSSSVRLMAASRRR